MRPYVAGTGAGAIGDVLGGLTQGISQGMELGLKKRYYDAQMAYQQQAAANQEKQLKLQETNQQINMLSKIQSMPTDKGKTALFELYAPQLGIDPKSPQGVLLQEGFKGPDSSLFIETFGGFLADNGLNVKSAADLLATNPEAFWSGLGVVAQQRKEHAAAAVQERTFGLKERELAEDERKNRAKEGMPDYQGSAVQGADGSMGIPRKNPDGSITWQRIGGAPGSSTDTFTPAPKPLTEAEGKNVGWLGRMQLGDQGIDEFLDANPDYLGSFSAKVDQTARSLGESAKYIGAGLGGVLGGILGKSPTAVGVGAGAGGAGGAALGGIAEQFLTSAEGKEYIAKASPFVNAGLRKDTGAAITSEEWTKAFAEWLPVPGDPPSVISTKARNRQEAIKGAEISAGSGAKQSSALSSGGDITQDAYDRLKPGDTFTWQGKTLTKGR